MSKPESLSTDEAVEIALAAAIPSLVAAIEKTVRAEMAKQSFAAASDLMTIEETCGYLRCCRDTLHERHRKRKRAGTAQKDVIFPPRTTIGSRVYYRRSKIDAWLGEQEG